jgi:hypothetical protein
MQLRKQAEVEAAQNKHQLESALQLRKQAEEEAAQTKLKAAQTKLELDQMAKEKAELV